jgi:hypothetical protein
MQIVQKKGTPSVTYRAKQELQSQLCHHQHAVQIEEYLGFENEFEFISIRASTASLSGEKVSKFQQERQFSKV